MSQAQESRSGCAIKIVSFGFKYGHPHANHCFDVSFAKDPTQQPGLHSQTQMDSAAINYVLGQDAVVTFIDFAIPLIEHLLTVDTLQIVAFGCDTGRHCSPTIADEVAKRLLRAGVVVQVEHRDSPEYEAFLFRQRQTDTV